MVVGLAPSAAFGRDLPKVDTDDIALANTAVVAATARLQAAEAALPAARGLVARTTAVVADARGAAAAAAASAQAAQAQSDLAARQLATAEDHAAAAAGSLDDVARALYVGGPETGWDVVLGAGDPGDFAERVTLVRVVTRTVDQTVRKWRAAQADLAQRLDTAAATAASTRQADATAATALRIAEGAQAAALASRQSLRALVIERARALAVANSHRGVVLAQYRAYRAEQARIARLAKLVGKGGPAPSGGLMWPIPGASVTGGVGWRVHPVYGYRSCHTGVDIRGSTGTRIYAAADGTVADVSNGGPYGLQTLIGHGGRLATMYAHQSRVAVRVGQVVRKGDLIGFVGSSGWVTGPHLHFEVHVNGVPYDPMGWFGGRVRVVPCYSG